MQGKLVKLRGYEKSDVDALIRWFSDEEVTDFVGPTEWPVTRAIRCYEKCGFKREGVWKEASYIGGRYVDVVTMGLLRADFDASRP